MDVNRAFNAPFKDQGWLGKAALGGLFAAIGLTAPALYGYAFDYIRSVANGRDEPLPEWNDFGRQWVRGLLFTIALTILMLPAIILWSVGFVPLIGMAASGSDPGAAAFGSICLFGLLGTAYAVVVSVYAFGAAVNYAMRDTFGSVFAFGEVLERIRSIPGYWQAWGLSLLVFFAAGAISGTVGGVLGSLGPLAIAAGFVGGFVSFVAEVMSAHLFGQWASAAYGTPGLTGGGFAPPPDAYVAPTPPPPPTPPAPPQEPPAPPSTPSGMPPEQG